jgi:hypothetical protein
MGYILGKSRAAIPLSHGPVYGMDMVDMWGWYYNGGGIELLQEWYQEELGLNIVSFPIAPAGPQALGWFNKEINSLEDIVGLKYRIYGIGNEVYGKIGVSVIQLPGAEILPALERGVLDAAEWVGGRMDLQLGFQDILKLHYTPGMHEPVTYSDLIINKDKFDSLGPDLQAIIEAREAAKKASGEIVKSGLGGFLYLEVLDASFSFDGVIGAFALSNNMIIIALGLSVGAMFVRSMTIHLVRTGTLAQYRYLEHGAFWAIIVLGVIMLLSARYHIPETITGLLGAVLIGLSFLWSVRHNRRHPEDSMTQPAD